MTRERNMSWVIVGHRFRDHLIRSTAVGCREFRRRNISLLAFFLNSKHPSRQMSHHQPKPRCRDDIAGVMSAFRHSFQRDDADDRNPQTAPSREEKIQTSGRRRGQTYVAGGEGKVHFMPQPIPAANEWMDRKHILIKWPWAADHPF